MKQRSKATISVVAFTCLATTVAFIKIYPDKTEWLADRVEVYSNEFCSRTGLCNETIAITNYYKRQHGEPELHSSIFYPVVLPDNSTANLEVSEMPDYSHMISLDGHIVFDEDTQQENDKANQINYVSSYRFSAKTLVVIFEQFPHACLNSYRVIALSNATSYTVSEPITVEESCGEEARSISSGQNGELVFIYADSQDGSKNVARYQDGMVKEMHIPPTSVAKHSDAAPAPIPVAYAASSSTAAAITGDIQLSPSAIIIAGKTYPLTLVRDIASTDFGEIGKIALSTIPTKAFFYKINIPHTDKFINGSDICGDADTYWMLEVDGHDSILKKHELVLVFFSGIIEPVLESGIVDANTPYCGTFSYRLKNEAIH